MADGSGTEGSGPALQATSDWRAVVVSGAYFFFILTSYYMLRPIRETMAIERGADKLPWLMTATLLAMLAANPAYAYLASRMPRRRFIPLTHWFFALNIAGFFAAVKLLAGERSTVIGYGFYVWLSVFNLFVVSIFWSVMADLFRRDRAAKVFGVVAVGGTLGAICGPAVVSMLLGGGVSVQVPWGGSGGAWQIVEFARLSREWVFLASLAPLSGAICCARWLIRRSEAAPRIAEGKACDPEPTRDAMAGFRLIASSRYLQTLSLYMLLFTITSTFIYLEQANMIASHFKSDAERTQAFARLDLYTNLLTLTVQLLLTRQIIRTVGVGGTLLILPMVTLAGFGVLAATGSIAALFGYQVLRRGVHYAVDRPAREILYTPLSPDEKYKSKAFIDTFVYRAGDLIGGWAPTWLATAGAWVGLREPPPTWLLWIPLSATWIATAAALGIMQRRLSGGVAVSQVSERSRTSRSSP